MSDTRPTVVLIDDQPTIRRLLKVYLKQGFQVLAEGSNGLDAIRLVEEHRPDFVIMDLDMPVMGGLEATEQIHRAHPQIPVVIASANSDIDSLRKAMSRGAREYLIKPFDREEVLACLERLCEHLGQRAEAREEESAGAPASGTWCFLGTGGEDGRTTFLLGIADQLKRLGHSVVVVDLELLFGDVAFYLGLDSEGRDLHGLLQQERFLEATVMEKFLLEHETGIRVLTGPTAPDKICEIEGDRLPDLVQGLESFFDYVLVDLPFSLEEDRVAILDRSRLVLPLSSMQPNKLKNLKLLHGILRRLGYSSTKLRPILTRTHKEEAAHWIERVQIDVARLLPPDADSARKAIQSGQPVTRAAPNSALTVAIREFLAPILKLPPEEIQPEPPGLLARLLG